MLIKRDETFEEVLLNELMEEVLDDTRTHPSMTDLIYCLTKNWLSAKRTSPREFSRQTKMYFAIGLGLEDAMLKRRKEVVHNGVCEGVSWHADSLDGDFIEFKTTRASMKNYPDSIPLAHHQQIMGYMKATGFRKVKYSVVFLIPGDMAVWDIEYTDAEVEANWEYLMLRKEVWDMADETGVAPESYRYNMDWECKSCDFRTLCDARASGVMA